jgi:PAS domain S-box-containing protein
MDIPNPAPHDAHEALRQSEERFRLLVEGVQDCALFMLDPAGIIVSWNAGAKRITGYHCEEIVGRHFSVFFSPEDVAAGKPEQELHLAAARGRVEDKCWRLRKDGSRFWASVVVTALRDPRGSLRGFAKLTHDVSERQRTEALTAANRLKDEFLCMLAHELRNPLGPLLTSVHVLRQPDSPGPARAASLDRIERQVRHLSRLVDDLLDVSRITRGQVQLHRERLDLARLVRTTVEDCRAGVEQAGLTLDIQAPPTPVWVVGDPTRLAQVFHNLLDNAAKFTARGGLIEVRQGVDEGQRQAVVAIRDTGEGIAPELLGRIWEVFAQADRSLDRASGGLGLGLALVKGLVGLHHGQVCAASAGPGHGTEMIVRLPLEPEPAALRDAAAVLPAGQRLRVVVIEDSRDAADSLRLLLEVLGNEVRVAYTGPDGVRAASAWKPDVVISDIGLPGLDGYGVATQLRRHPATARALLIGLSGYGREEDIRRAGEAGFDHYLVKPAAPEQLLRLLAAGKG